MPPYEALYGQKCRSLICWDEVGERKVLGPELVQQSKEIIELIQKRLVAAQTVNASMKIKPGRRWNMMKVKQFC